ncbi:hypothetical protein [Hoeflea sp.]|uniref:hypothetical protein n=1 Tax=unclassified Hoeflea TaxID=2614931 RepID=UPI002AFE8873|nr:hypothetical protein [Hoeflea sp.]
MLRRIPAPTDSRRRWQDAAFAIPVFVVLLLLPPVLNLFTIRRLLFGIPLEVVYLFTIWAALVMFGALLSRGLPHQIDVGEDADKSEPENT